jgi:type IV pilus assembly protein PilM
MLLSIDVGSDSFFAVEGSYAAGVVNVVKTGDVRFPTDTVEDGIIKNHAAFIMSLGKMIASKSFKTTACVYTFNSSSILSRRLDLPASKPREMAGMVKNEMLQTVNETNEYIFEYSMINDTGPNPLIKSVWAYAIPRDVVDEYYSVHKNIKLRPVALDIHPNSVEKLFLNASVNGVAVGGRSILFVNIEEEIVEIHLFSDAQRAFSRITPFSSSEFRLLLSNAGLAGNFDGLDVTAENFVNNQILNEALHQYVNRLAEELQKMIQFQLRRNASNPVRSVYIYGGMSCIKGLDACIASALGVAVENIETISKVNAQGVNLSKYINAIGAIIRL